VNNLVFVNGDFLPAEEARISIFDGGFLHGAGLFETMRADYGQVFRFDAHVDRMLDSPRSWACPFPAPTCP